MRRCVVCEEGKEHCRKKVTFNANIACATDYNYEWDWSRIPTDNIYQLFDLSMISELDIPLIT